MMAGTTLLTSSTLSLLLHAIAGRRDGSSPRRKYARLRRHP
jgi:hypothetical protein